MQRRIFQCNVTCNGGGGEKSRLKVLVFLENDGIVRYDDAGGINSVEILLLKIRINILITKFFTR